MKTILFVDDEPHIIDGLQRSLRPMRHEWKMVFANSGAQALERLAQESFDVVVTDMRMPGISGAQLLTEVLKQYPHIVRIMLSGHSDLQAIMQSVGPTHQYLSKPCNVDHLKETIANACALRDLLGSATLRGMVAEMKSLPSLPGLYAEIIEAAQSSEMPLAAIGAVIARDVGMTAKMLQLVNSAFFGLPHHVTNASEAVGMLGLDTVRALILSFHVFEECDAILLPDFSAEKLWHHSLLVGKLAKQIATLEGGDRRLCEDAYTAGLLHDAGKLALAIHLPRPYAEALALAQAQNLPIFEAETTILGASHAEVGAYLLGLWGLPKTIVEALAFHHCPEVLSEAEFSPLSAVYAADCLVNSVCPNNTAYFKAMGKAERISLWAEACRKIIE